MIPTSSSPGSGSLWHSRMSKTFPLQLTAKVFDLRPSGTELHPWGNLSQFILRFELLHICDLCCVIVSLIGSGLRSHILSFCLSGCLSVCHQQAHIFPPCSVCDSCPHSSVFPRRKPTVFSMAFLMSSDTFPGRPYMRPNPCLFPLPLWERYLRWLPANTTECATHNSSALPRCMGRIMQTKHHMVIRSWLVAFDSVFRTRKVTKETQNENYFVYWR